MTQDGAPVRNPRELAPLSAPSADGAVSCEIDRLRHEVKHLKRAMLSRATIEQAKGIVMATQHCTPEDAFQALVVMSRNSNVPLRDVASALVYQVSDAAERKAAKQTPPGG